MLCIMLTSRVKAATIMGTNYSERSRYKKKTAGTTIKVSNAVLTTPPITGAIYMKIEFSIEEERKA